MADAPAPYPPAPRRETVSEIESHLARQFGPPQPILHEVDSPFVHIDLQLFSPSAERGYWTVATTGMSDLAMRDSKGTEHHAELLLHLPKDWRMDLLLAKPAPPDLEHWWWPLRWLKIIARHPHATGAFVWGGHSFPNQDPPRPIANTGFHGVVLLPPTLLPEDAWELPLSDGREVVLFNLVPLYLDELELKLTAGLEALCDAFDALEVSDVIDPQRPSAARGRWASN